MDFYDAALKRAQKSKHAKYKMAAIVYKSRRVLSIACNGARFGRHAEIRALSRDLNFSGAEVAVARWPEGISKPCGICLALLINCGIASVVYHDGQQVVMQSPEHIDPHKFRGHGSMIRHMRRG